MRPVATVPTVAFRLHNLGRCQRQTLRVLAKEKEVMYMKGHRSLFALLACLLAACLMAPAAFGQSLVSGDLVGTITDPSGAVVSNAPVTLTSNGTGETRNTTTNSSGL